MADVIQLPTAASNPVKQPRIRRPASVPCLARYRNERSAARQSASEDIAVHEKYIAEYSEQLRWSVFQLANEKRTSLRRLVAIHEECLGQARNKAN